MSVKVQSIVEDPDLIARRRSQLVLAAIKLFSREGFHATTVKSIAQAAKVSAGLVYQYVRDKQDLLFLSLLHIVQTNREEIPAALTGVTNPIDRLSRAIEAYARVMDANRDAVLLTYRESKSLTRAYRDVLKSMEIDTNRLISGCIEDCIRQGLMNRIEVELLTYQLVIIAHAWALKYWRLSKITTLDHYIATSIHPVWQHQLTPAGKNICDTRRPLTRRSTRSR